MQCPLLSHVGNSIPPISAELRRDDTTVISCRLSPILIERVGGAFALLN
jgi:hypothetical protein